MSHVLGANGAMRNVNRNLHRPSVMPDDEASAPEGGIPHGHWRENQGRPIHEVPRPLKVPRHEPESDFIVWLGVGSVVVVAIVATCAMVFA